MGVWPGRPGRNAAVPLFLIGCWAANASLPPEARWDYSCEGLTCTFDGSASTGDIVEWRWELPNGRRFGSTPVAQRTFGRTGSGEITLVVVDASGARDSLTRTVVIGGPAGAHAAPAPAPSARRPAAPPADRVSRNPTMGTGDWRVVFSDDFESGNLEATQAGYRWTASEGGAGEIPRVTTTRARSGTHALEFTFLGSRNPRDDAWSEQRFRFGEPLAAVALDYWIWIPASYRHRNAEGPDNNKFLRLWDDDYQQYHVKVGFSTQWNNGPHPKVIAEAGVNRSGMETRGLRGWARGFTAAHHDRWTHIRVEVELGTATHGGVMRLFVDDDLVSENRNMAIYPAGGVGNYLRNGYLFGWANTGFDATTSVFVDDFTVLAK